MMSHGEGDDKSGDNISFTSAPSHHRSGIRYAGQLGRDGNDALLPITPDPLTDSMLLQQVRGSDSKAQSRRAAVLKRKRGELRPDEATGLYE